MPVFGMRKQREGEVRAQVIEGVHSSDIHAAVCENIAPGSTLYTDEHRGYWGLKEYAHTAVKHTLGQYVEGDAHTNSIESFWALFKRGYHGIYHWMSRKHLQAGVDEFVFRLNRKGQKSQSRHFPDVVEKSLRANGLSLQGANRMSRPQKVHKPPGAGSLPFSPPPPRAPERAKAHSPKTGSKGSEQKARESDKDHSRPNECSKLLWPHSREGGYEYVSLRWDDHFYHPIVRLFSKMTSYGTIPEAG